MKDVSNAVFRGEDPSAKLSQEQQQVFSFAHGLVCSFNLKLCACTVNILNIIQHMILSTLAEPLSHLCVFS